MIILDANKGRFSLGLATVRDLRRCASGEYGAMSDNNEALHEQCWRRTILDKRRFLAETGHTCMR